MKTATNVYDRAYGAFLYCGIGALWFALTSPPSGTEGLFPLGLTLVLGLLFVLGGFVALVVAVISTIKLWRHWPLLGLAVLTAVFIYVEAAYSNTNSFSDPLVSTMRWSYVALATGLPLWWFSYERRRRDFCKPW